MKKISLLLGAVVTLVFALALVGQQPAKSNSNLLGTWQLVSTKYDPAKDFTDYPKDHRRLKLISLAAGELDFLENNWKFPPLRATLLARESRSAQNGAARCPR
jgi:hypothetical protein